VGKELMNMIVKTNEYDKGNFTAVVTDVQTRLKIAELAKDLHNVLVDCLVAKPHSHGFTYMLGKAEYMLRQLKNAVDLGDCLQFPELVVETDFDWVMSSARSITHTTWKEGTNLRTHDIKPNVYEEYIAACENLAEYIRFLRHLADGDEMYIHAHGDSEERLTQIKKKLCEKDDVREGVSRISRRQIEEWTEKERAKSGEEIELS
jgi:hypothetical protein